MRLLVLSDLHVDYPQNMQRARSIADAFLREDAEALVIAGDVSHKPDQIEAALRLFDGFGGPRLFVPGNHDVWVVRGPPEDSWQKLDLVDDVCRRSGFHNLERRNATVGPFTFVGTMGWYDYSFASPALALREQDYARKTWHDLTYMDAKYAKWGEPDADVAAWFTAAVRKRLHAAEGPVVFVSHHVPLEELVLRRGHASWDFFNAYMGSRELEHVVRTAGVSRFVFGHTHRPVTFIGPQRFVINNPLGYPREALNPVRTSFDVT
ncbi:MAG: metallophosphoesterase [Euryarchaeota archaeon]|nr:metallophosphoesterase [Euryarchaeota archaeon]